MTSRFALNALNENQEALILSLLELSVGLWILGNRYNLPRLVVFIEIIGKVFEFFLHNKFVCVKILEIPIAFINQVQKNCFFKVDNFIYGFVFQLLISFFDVVISTPNNHTRNFVRLLSNNAPIIF